MNTQCGTVNPGLKLMKMMRLTTQMILYCALLAVVSITSVIAVVAAEEQTLPQRQEGVHEREEVFGWER